jgi:hypothetical protein
MSCSSCSGAVLAWTLIDNQHLGCETIWVAPSWDCLRFAKPTLFLVHKQQFGLMLQLCCTTQQAHLLQACTR